VYLKDLFLIGYSCQIDRSVSSGIDIVVDGRRRVIVGEQSVSKIGEDVVDEIVDLGRGPVLHGVSDDDQVSALVDLPQSLYDAVFAVGGGFSLDLLHDLEADVRFLLEQDVLHHLPVAEADLDYPLDFRPRYEML